MSGRSPTGRALSAAGRLRRRASLSLATLRRLRPRQIAARLARLARFRGLYPWLAGGLFGVPAPLAADPLEGPLDEARAAAAEPAADLLRQAADLAAHRFAFLNLPAADLGTPVDWRHAPGGDRLWGYCLHYGEWALILAQAALATGEGRHLEALVELLGDWIGHNPAGRAPSWEPYPISRRLVAWSRLPAALGRTAPGRDFWRLSLEPSLRRQARFLAANLEHDLPNNHLLANYRALAWVGLRFDHWPESRRWRRLGLAGLWREMARQVLSDGVHFERSITYHTAALKDLLETWHLARSRPGAEPPGEVAESLQRMLRFLAATRTAGGTWPMVNDSVPGDPIDPRALLLAGAALFDRRQWAAAGSPRSHAAWLGLGEAVPPLAEPSAPRLAVFPDAGYAVLRGGEGGYLFFDAGAMGPAEVPGHGHADALSIVLQLGRRPLIVDPGVETYEAGESRDHCRSMRAHSTVEIDGQDPCVFWGPFRVAHPPPARLLEWSQDHLLGEHRGYLRLPEGVVHRRRIARRPGGAWEIRDRFTGRGRHRFASTLQLAPGAEARLAETGGEAVWPGGVRLEIRPLAAPQGAAAELAAGWVSSGWNRRQPAPRYVLRWTAEVPCEVRLLLTAYRDQQDPTV